MTDQRQQTHWDGPDGGLGCETEHPACAARVIGELRASLAAALARADAAEAKTEQAGRDFRDSVRDIASLSKKFSLVSADRDRERQRAEGLAARVKRLEKALKFYAAKNNYAYNAYVRVKSDLYYPPVMRDDGEMARAALSGDGGGRWAMADELRKALEATASRLHLWHTDDSRTSFEDCELVECRYVVKALVASAPAGTEQIGVARDKSAEERKRLADSLAPAGGATGERVDLWDALSWYGRHQDTCALLETPEDDEPGPIGGVQCSCGFSRIMRERPKSARAGGATGEQPGDSLLGALHAFRLWLETHSPQPRPMFFELDRFEDGYTRALTNVRGGSLWARVAELMDTAPADAREAERERVISKLLSYTRHYPTCPGTTTDCHCGLREVLAEIRALDAAARSGAARARPTRAGSDQCPCGHSRSMHLTEADECLYQFEDGLFCACPYYVPTPLPAGDKAEG